MPKACAQKSGEWEAKNAIKKDAPKKTPKAPLSWLPKFLGLWALPDTHQSGTSLLEHLNGSLELLNNVPLQDAAGPTKSCFTLWPSLCFCVAVASLLLTLALAVKSAFLTASWIKLKCTNRIIVTTRPFASKFLCTKAPGRFTSQQLGCLPFAVDSGRASKEF